MGSFFKSFGKGILYILTLPAVLIVLVFYAIVGLFTFIFLMLKSVVLFFKGKTIFSELPEDKRAREILNPTPKQDDEVEIVEPEDPITSAFTQTFYQSPITQYPTGEQTKVKEIDFEEDIKELESPQEIIHESIEEDEYDDPYFEEPEYSETHDRSDDLDLDHFDLGSKRIIKDDKE